LPPSIALASITDKSERIERREELRLLWHLGWPVGLAALLRAAMTLTDLAVLGHCSTEWLAGASAALVWLQLTGMILSRAFGGALGPLCASAFSAGAFRLVGFWLQIALVFSTLSALLVSVAWVHTGSILSGMGVEEGVANQAGEYALWAQIYLPAMVWLELLLRYFHAQQASFLPGLVLYALSLPLNLLVQMLLVQGVPRGWFPSFLSASLHDHGWDGLGVKGSAIATAVTRWGMLLLFWGWACGWKRLHAQTWTACGGWNLSTRTGAMHRARVRVFLREHVLPALGGCLVEEVPLATLALLATCLPDAPGDDADVDRGGLATATKAIVVQHVSMELLAFLSAPLAALSFATQERTAYFLSSRSVAAAKQVAVLGGQIMLALGVVGCGTLMSLRSVMGYTYSSSPAVVSLAERGALLLGGVLMALGVFYALVAVLHAQGRSNAVALSFGAGNWMVALPLAGALAYSAGLGLRGLWIALLSGYVSSIIILAVELSFRTDWEKQAEEALWRLKYRQRLAAAGEDDPARKELEAAAAIAAGKDGKPGGRRKRRKRNNPMSPVGNRSANTTLTGASGVGGGAGATGDAEAEPSVVAPEFSDGDLTASPSASRGGSDDEYEDDDDDEEQEEVWNAEEIAYKQQQLLVEQQRAATMLRMMQQQQQAQLRAQAEGAGANRV